MKRLINLALLLALSSLPLAAIADDTPDPAATRAEMMEKMMPAMMERNLPGMGMHRGAPTGVSPCMNSALPPCQQHRMGNGPLMLKQGMWPDPMEHDLYIDRAEELGLSGEQLARLKAIRSAVRKDNIRTGAELKIVYFDLADLKDANADAEQLEPLVRQIKTLEGDIELRHYQAKAEARKVLTAEQLKKAETSESLEDLF